MEAEKQKSKAREPTDPVPRTRGWISHPQSERGPDFAIERSQCGPDEVTYAHFHRETASAGAHTSKKASAETFTRAMRYLLDGAGERIVKPEYLLPASTSSFSSVQRVRNGRRNEKKARTSGRRTETRSKGAKV